MVSFFSATQLKTSSQLSPCPESGLKRGLPSRTCAIALTVRKGRDEMKDSQIATWTRENTHSRPHTYF